MNSENLTGVNTKMSGLLTTKVRPYKSLTENETIQEIFAHLISESLLNIIQSIIILASVYANDFIKVYETGKSTIEQDFATKTELTNINTANASSIQANTDAIDVLNTKQLQNFNNINAINTDLTDNYQTNSTLSSTFYNKTEIDTTFTSYYTSTQIDTNLSTNFQTNTQLQNNYYNKTQIDANNWIDATALTPYALSSTLATDYYTTRTNTSKLL